MMQQPVDVSCFIGEFFSFDSLTPSFPTVLFIRVLFIDMIVRSF